MSSQRYRAILFAGAAFALNLLYALYHCALGVLNRSLWFIAMCAFYGILATMRFAAVLCGRNHHKYPSDDSDDTEQFVMKFSGILLVALGAVLAAVNYISLSQNIAAKYEEIMMITIAAYTFGKITMAGVKAVKQRRNPSPLLRTIRTIGYDRLRGGIRLSADVAAVHAGFLWLHGPQADPLYERYDGSRRMPVRAAARSVHDSKIE